MTWSLLGQASSVGVDWVNLVTQLGSFGLLAWCAVYWLPKFKDSLDSAAKLFAEECEKQRKAFGEESEKQRAECNARFERQEERHDAAIAFQITRIDKQAALFQEIVEATHAEVELVKQEIATRRSKS